MRTVDSKNLVHSTAVMAFILGLWLHSDCGAQGGSANDHNDSEPHH